MEICIILTAKEKELVALFKRQGNLSAKDDFMGWGSTREWDALNEHNLIHHYNGDNWGGYIRYKLTELGELAYKQNCV